MADFSQLPELAGNAGSVIISFISNSKELFSALLGAFLGGWWTSKTTKRAHELQVEEKQQQDRRVLNNTLILIRSELEAAWNIYQKEFAAELFAVPEYKSYMTLLPIGKNPFPIYDSAPACLAEAPPEISALIVHIYMRAKGLVETIDLNNEAFRLSSEHAREAVAVADKKYSVGEVDLNDLYESELHAMGEFLHMPGIAKSMKDLTVELDGCLGVLMKKITDFVSQK